MEEEIEGSVLERSKEYYNSIEDIFQDMTNALGLPWIYFIKLYENAFETYRFNINEDSGGIKDIFDMFKSEHPGYFDAIIRFNDEINDILGDSISPEFYNKLMALAFVMPKVSDFIKNDKSKQLKSFNDSIIFLNKIKDRFKNKAIPMDFYTNFSVIVMMEDLKIKYEYKKHSKESKMKAKEEVKKWMDVLRNLFLMAIINIVQMLKTKKYKSRDKKIKISETHSYYHIKGDRISKAYKIDFFDELNRAMTILILGDKRCGKTIGWLKVMESAIEQGYTIFVFGKDTRLEMRWASFPMDDSVVKPENGKSLYDKLIEQGQEPRGLPIKIYNNNPEYPIEYDISDFGGTPDEWESQSGIVVFEDDLIRISKSFGEWRSRNKTKKIIAMLNEMHEFIPSMPKKGKWGLTQDVKDVFTHIGGWRCPLIGTTQRVSLIDSSARQIDIIIASYHSNIKDRKAIADIIGDKRIAHYMDSKVLKKNNHFWMFKGDEKAKIKFIIPRCMPESSGVSDLDEMFKNRKNKEFDTNNN